MRTAIAIWTRTAESDTWTCSLSAGRAHIEELDLRGQRATSEVLQFGATHVARIPMAWQAYVIEGRRLVRTSDAAEFVIGQVRVNDEPPERHVRAYLRKAEATTA